MKYSLCLLIFCLSLTIQAQETEPLSLDNAIEMAWKSSNQSKISNERLTTAKEKIQEVKNNQYPDFGISGQALYLNKPNLKLKIPTSSADSENEDNNQTASPKPNYLLLGQANVSMPIFSGFKIKNAVKASKNNYKATQFSSKSDQVDIALNTIKLYVELYKARKLVDLIHENLKINHRRVKDFSDLEENGLLARNDLLKVKLQESNVKLSLARAEKNARLINYSLSTFLKLPENTKIQIDTLSFQPTLKPQNVESENARPEIQSLEYQQKAVENNIKIAKSNYFPSIAVTAGYLAADIENTLTVSNAINVGLGISYNLSDIFKSKSKVKIAKSKAQTIQYQLDEVKDQISIQVRNAEEEYNLSLENYQVFQESKEQSKENYRIVKDKFDNGLLETRDLLEADVQRLQSQIDLANGKADITQKYYELKKAKGQLINEFSNNN